MKLLKVCTTTMKALAQLTGLVALVIFLPRLFITISNDAHQQVPLHTEFKLGLETLSSEYLQKFASSAKPCSIALVTNQSGNDQHGNRNIDILRKKGAHIECILTPQYGFNHDQRDKQVKYFDPLTNIPIFAWSDNFYKLINNHMKQVDLIVFDLQDSGMRYGYMITLCNALELAARSKKKLLVLDRPNLLGSMMEGTVASIPTKHKQRNAVPLRYGMTVGELSHYFNNIMFKSAVDLEVVPMQHYSRTIHKQTAGMCGNVSTNINSLDSCYGYSFLGLLGEIAPFDIGLGTEKAFQCLALPDSIQFPKQKWYEVRAFLKERGIESRMYRYFSQRKKQYCQGLAVCIQDINEVASFGTTLHLIKYFKDAGVALKLSADFDRLVGSPKVRKFLDGNITFNELEHEINEGLKEFFQKASGSFIYLPVPKIGCIVG